VAAAAATAAAVGIILAVLAGPCKNIHHILHIKNKTQSSLSSDLTKNNPAPGTRNEL
jgi:hypothetical protein